MADQVIDQIVAELRGTASKLYPNRSELRNVRVVGHTPKPEHYIYDIVIDFADANERATAKVYRSAKDADTNRAAVSTEYANLCHVHSVFHKRRLTGVPRPLGDFTALGAIVSEKFVGMPLQSIIMKAALLPGYADRGTLAAAARKTGDWLRSFHKATAELAAPFDSNALIADLERLCNACRHEGLNEESVQVILDGARAALARTKKTLPASAVLNDFAPLNVVVAENGIGICDYAKMQMRGTSFHDVANFLASVESLEKYPFCNRTITTQVQDEFVEAYGASASDMAVLRVMKMRTLLAMFAHGRAVKESALRKKIMWANVMKKFITQAAQRSLAPAA